MNSARETRRATYLKMVMQSQLFASHTRTVASEDALITCANTSLVFSICMARPTKKLDWHRSHAAAPCHTLIWAYLAAVGREDCVVHIRGVAPELFEHPPRFEAVHPDQHGSP